MPYWAVIRAVPNHDRLAAECVALAGFETFVPKIRTRVDSRWRNVQPTICCRLAELLDAEDHGQRRQIRRSEIPRKPRRRKIKPALRIQYAALPYRFTPDAALEILLVTTRRSKRWIIPKGWPIKGLRPAKSAAREAFEEAGVRGKIGRNRSASSNITSCSTSTALR
jgi:ADP-ribose pyrophosphatase YjhB (NUDIX family)